MHVAGSGMQRSQEYMLRWARDAEQGTHADKLEVNLPAAFFKPSCTTFEYKCSEPAHN